MVGSKITAAEDLDVFALELSLIEAVYQFPWLTQCISLCVDVISLSVFPSVWYTNFVDWFRWLMSLSVFPSVWTLYDGDFEIIDGWDLSNVWCQSGHHPQL
jgi:hypothetical protein